jgi:hypothetical protein
MTGQAAPMRKKNDSAKEKLILNVMDETKTFTAERRFVSVGG